MRLITIYSFLLLLLIGISCTNSSSENNNTSDTEQTSSDNPSNASGDSTEGNTENTEKDKGKEDTHLFGPSEYIAGIPVYNTFDEIEHIFHKDSDTTYLINFWATWCKPCVEELPYFEKINKNYKDEKVKVLLVSMDFKKLTEHRLIPFIEENNVESDVYLLADGRTSKWIDRVSKQWDGAIPYSILYRKTDRKEFGIVDKYDDLDQIIKIFLGNS